MNSFIITGSGITIFMIDDGSQHTIKSDHPRFADICKLASEDKFNDILDIIDIRATVDKFVYSSENGRFAIENGILTFDGTEMHSSLADRMIDFAIREMDLTAMQNFMINLMDNPSYRAVTELYGFLEVGKLPITNDGHFLAYKKVRSNFTDVHSGKFDNSPGCVVTMPRNQVNEDKNQTCSTGLHFCSYDYLSDFSGQRVIVVKINPRDVVSIPSDYNNTKGRCCKYEVLRELEDYVEERIEGFHSGEFDRNDEEDSADWDDDWGDGFGDHDDDGDYDDHDDDGDGDDYDGHDDDDYDDANDIDQMYYDASDHDPLEQRFAATTGGQRLVADHHIGITSGSDPAQDYPQTDMGDPAHGAPVSWVQKSMNGIIATDQRNNVTYRYGSVIEAHKELGVPVEYIRRVLEGERENAMGYVFTYAE